MERRRTAWRFTCKRSTAHTVGTYDSPDRAVYDLPLAELAASDDRLSFSAPSVKAHYAAKWDTHAQSWLGRWTVDGRDYALNLIAGV